MAENIIITADTKEGIYEEIVPQIEALVSDEPDMIANMANVSAVLSTAFGFLWAGFYIVRNGADGKELVLGPFQGPVACTRIRYGRGVCGTAWKNGSTLVVPDVDKFPGHIACSSLSRSEIVVPVFSCGDSGKNAEIVAVLDIDSVETETFDDTDKKYLEKIVSFICK